MASPRNRRRIIKRDSDAVSRQEFEELRAELERLTRSVPPWLAVQSVPADGGGDESYGFRFAGRSDLADFADAASEAVPISDEGTPTAPPNVILDPGPGWLQARWLLPSGTVDPLFYHVFIDTTPGFTADFGVNWVGTTYALSYVINLDGAGSQLQTGTTYYVKVYAVSSYSGLSSEFSTEASGTPDVLDATVTTISNLDAGAITVGELDAARIGAGSIDASKFSAVLALVSSLFAGTEGAQRVEVGYGTNDDGSVDTTWIGIRAYDVDGETVTFSVNADTGEVFIGGTLGNTVLAGAMTFGAGSIINSNDTITIREQPPGSYQTPAIVQSAVHVSNSGGPINCAWDQPTVDGNLLVCAVLAYGAPTAPSLSTPSGWTRIGSILTPLGNYRMAVYYIEESATRSGTQQISYPSGNLDGYEMVLMEVSGAKLFDVTAAASGGPGTAVDSGATLDTTQAEEFVLGVLGFQNDFDGTPAAPTPAGWTLQEEDAGAGNGRLAVYWQNVASVGPQQFTATLAESKGWSARVATFTAKATALPASDADKLKLYAKDASDAARLYAMDENGVEHDLFLPPGTVLPYAGASAPDGFLLADGSAVSRTTYAALFDAIGTTYGSGDGSTTFNLPDLSGRVPVGKHASWTEFDALGETGGNRTHTLARAEVPQQLIQTLTGAQVREWAAAQGGGGTNALRVGGTDNQIRTDNANGSAGVPGNVDGHNNLQPYITLNYVIKV